MPLIYILHNKLTVHLNTYLLGIEIPADAYTINT